MLVPLLFLIYINGEGDSALPFATGHHVLHKAEINREEEKNNTVQGAYRRVSTTVQGASSYDIAKKKNILGHQSSSYDVVKAKALSVN